MATVRGSSIGFLNCPHCGKEMEFYINQRTAYLICSDHNCWGGMSCTWGSEDEPYRFIEKMKSTWNKRTPEGHAIVEAESYIRRYRDEIKQRNQEEYSDYCGCCVEVLDEVLNKLQCFIS